MKSGLPFIGREALEKRRNAPLRKKLVCFTVDDPSVVLLGRETIYRNGERVGWVGSAGFGHTIGKPIAYGYVRQPEGDVTDEFVLSGAYELDVATTRVPAKAYLKPLYDEQRTRILG
nr:glycine cleavage T C-terminal barrel domain-containing protein [Acetobacter papayae]